MTCNVKLQDTVFLNSSTLKLVKEITFVNRELHVVDSSYDDSYHFIILSQIWNKGRMLQILMSHSIWLNCRIWWLSSSNYRNLICFCKSNMNDNDIIWKNAYLDESGQAVDWKMTIHLFVWPSQFISNEVTILVTVVNESVVEDL